LYRTPADLEAVLPLSPNLRLVKGAYLEPPLRAYPRKADVDRVYKNLISRALSADGYTAIATHDEDAVRYAIETGASRRLPKRGRFEFQMLYGVRPTLQKRLIAAGFTVRIAAPYGRSWYPYFMRRLAERPANVAFMLRSMVRG
jgi:proline dehydrogenase